MEQLKKGKINSRIYVKTSLDDAVNEISDVKADDQLTTAITGIKSTVLKSKNSSELSVSIGSAEAPSADNYEASPLGQSAADLRRVRFSPRSVTVFFPTSKTEIISPRAVLRSTSPRPILKSPKRPEALTRFKRSIDEESKRLPIMQRGAHLQLYGKEGDHEPRFFWISPDGSELRWAKPKGSKLVLFKGISPNPDPAKITSFKSIALAEVAFMVFGPRTYKFRGFSWLTSHPENCFSLVLYDHKTVDVQCADRKEFMDWYLGLRSLTPLSKKTMTRAQINWHRALYKTMQFAKLNKVDLSTVWHELVALAREKEAGAKAKTSLQAKMQKHFLNLDVVVVSESKTSKDAEAVSAQEEGEKSFVKFEMAVGPVDVLESSKQVSADYF